MHPLKTQITTFLKSQHLNTASWYRIVMYIIQESKMTRRFIEDDLHRDLAQELKELIKTYISYAIQSNITIQLFIKM